MKNIHSVTGKVKGKKKRTDSSENVPVRENNFLRDSHDLNEEKKQSSKSRERKGEKSKDRTKKFKEDDDEQ